MDIFGEGALFCLPHSPKVKEKCKITKQKIYKKSEIHVTWLKKILRLQQNKSWHVQTVEYYYVVKKNLIFKVYLNHIGDLYKKFKQN